MKEEPILHYTIIINTNIPSSFFLPLVGDHLTSSVRHLWCLGLWVSVGRLRLASPTWFLQLSFHFGDIFGFHFGFSPRCGDRIAVEKTSDIIFAFICIVVGLRTSLEPFRLHRTGFMFAIFRFHL